MALTLDRRITIQSPTETQDAQGTPVQVWTTYATRWAKMESATTDTSESHDGDSRVAFRGTDWMIYRDSTTKNITEKMRVLYNSEIYDIDSVQENTDERRHGYLMLHTIKRGSVDE